jgi:hypothetical protein
MKIIYCDDEISFILHMSINLLEVNVVRWMVPGFGVVEKDRTEEPTIRYTRSSPSPPPQNLEPSNVLHSPPTD